MSARCNSLPRAADESRTRVHPKTPSKLQLVLFKPFQNVPTPVLCGHFGKSVATAGNSLRHIYLVGLRQITFLGARRESQRNLAHEE